MRRLRQNVSAEIPEACRFPARIRPSALHPVLLLPGTLPERRDHAADDADDAVRESRRQAVSREPDGKNLIDHECSSVPFSFRQDRKNRKKTKKNAIFLETDWKKRK